MFSSTYKTMSTSISPFILPRPRRGLNHKLGRRRLLASLLLLALFPLGLSAQDAIRIVTKTELHSANWLWSEERKIDEYSEYDEFTLLDDGKAGFPRDYERKTIGIGEKIKLKVKEKPGSNVAGDKSKASWAIIEGGGWADFEGPTIGESVIVGAEVLDGPASRTIKVRVTTDTTPALTADVAFTVVKPSGGFKSRHAGPPPPNADVPSTAQSSPPNTVDVPVSNTNPAPNPPPPTISVDFTPMIGAMSKLVVIPEPTSVNFGGDFKGGVYFIVIRKLNSQANKQLY